MTIENSSGKIVWLCRKLLTYVGQEKQPKSKHKSCLKIMWWNVSEGITGDENAKVTCKAALCVPAAEKTNGARATGAPARVKPCFSASNTFEFSCESGLSEQAKTHCGRLWFWERLTSWGTLFLAPGGDVSDSSQGQPLPANLCDLGLCVDREEGTGGTASKWKAHN